MARGIFVTGTDTGVGKTVISAGILRRLRREGIDAVPMKPVQTGGVSRGGRLEAPDLNFSLAAAGLKPSPPELDLMAPYVYAPACSPHLAGRLKHRYAEIDHIRVCADKLLQRHASIIVEGAGGVMAPVGEKKTALDLMEALAYPVVLVAHTALGTINHTLLSISALRSRNLPLLGVVFCQLHAPDPANRFIEEENPQAVSQFGNAPVLGIMRHFGPIRPEDEALWAAFDQDVTGMAIIRKALES